MKGAVDDTKEIQSIFEKIDISKKYLHAAYALSGIFLPFQKETTAWNSAMALKASRFVGTN